MFDFSSKLRIAKGVLLRSNPLYVQFYVTARCNLTCQQCNIVYANSDVTECGIEEVERIARNLSKLGTAIVLLTGGEPFARKDLPEIVKAFRRNGIHVRMQTNGTASEEALARCVEHGARDISISLDTLDPELQDSINGGFSGSWRRALEAVSRVTKVFPADESFAAFGCVLAPRNIEHVPDVVRFGTEIGFYTSLVPIHVTDQLKPMGFRTYDKDLGFRPEHVPRVDALIARLREMKREGCLLYDSEEYLDNIARFVRGEPLTWRRRNDEVCDSPGLYFAILPNGHFAVCCDHRLHGESVPVYDPAFPEIYRDREFRGRVEDIARRCPGCMFGSFPEITITARYWRAMTQRARVFLAGPPQRRWPMEVEEVEAFAKTVREERGGKGG